MTKHQTSALDFYGVLKDSPSAARRVGWQSDALHELRLRTLLEALGSIDEVGKVVDAGCGEGRLLPLLRDAGFTGAYCGEDVLPHMVERAKTNYPDESFLVVNSFDKDAPHADIIVCSGTLNTLSSDDPEEAFREALTSLWSRADFALVIDFAVADRHSDGAGITSYEVEECLRTARTLTRWVRLIEDTIPGEAILVMARSSESGLRRISEREHLALAIAELHLREHAPTAARAALLGIGNTKASMFRALADAQSGRVRDAEESLRTLSEESAEAKLHLALLLIATRRQAQGTTLLEDLRQEDGDYADAARYQLMLQYIENRPELLGTLLEEIKDPWIHREAAALANSGG